MGACVLAVFYQTDTNGPPLRTDFYVSQPARPARRWPQRFVQNSFARMWPSEGTSGTRREQPNQAKIEARHLYQRAASCKPNSAIKDARAAAIKPNEQSAVDPTQIQSTAWRTPKHVELMSQYQDFGLQPPSRL